MASFQLNGVVKTMQRRTLVAVVLGLTCVFIAVITLAAGGKSHQKKTDPKAIDLTGIVDESFGEANTESALSSQQAELESLKAQIKQMQVAFATKEKADEQAKQAANVSAQVVNAVKTPSAPSPAGMMLADNTRSSRNTKTDAQVPWTTTYANNQARVPARLLGDGHPVPPRVHSVSFRYGTKKRGEDDNHLNPEHYVPSGTFVRAVILGGADADASVNGQSKNNGVMLFKLLQPGTLPNGQHSRLQGCFVTASSYGDISSERAYVILDKLSCAQSGRPIIDKAVTGWAFFGGKVGIKGQPLMRDNKVMQWAGISGAMSGIAAAAQYSQSVQSISALGSATVVPSSNIAPYSAYGGASKAADVLSNYYVKRAEQYHPVIQVGSGNLVTIVFKDGFYLEPDETLVQQSRQRKAARFREAREDEAQLSEGNFDFNVPPAVLNKIDHAYGTRAPEGDNA